MKKTDRTFPFTVARFDLLTLRMTTEVLLLVTIAYAMAEFTSWTASQRQAALFQAHCAPVLSLTSISPWLVSSTVVMLRQRRLRLLCVFEWIHCLSAAFHHVLEYDIFVQIGGVVFLVWAWVMLRVKATMSRGNNNCTHLSRASVLLYLHLWRQYGHVFILSGTGPLLAIVPFVYLLIISGEMQLSDLPNYAFLGLLFVAENLSNTSILQITSAEVKGQVLHLAGHLGISYFIHDLNRRHFFNMDEKKINTV